MIRNLSLRNFKAFEEQSIDFRPITLFLGPNNAGKSSMLAALRILVQTVESYDPQIPILLNGVMGDFGTYRDVVFGNSSRRHIHIHLSIGGERFIGRDIESSPEDFWRGRKKTTEEVEVRYAYRSRRREIILTSTELKKDGRLLFSTRYSEESERQSIDRIGSRAVPSSLKSTISKSIRMQNFMPNVFPSSFVLRSRESENSALQEFLNKEIEEIARQAHRTSSNIYQNLRRIEYLGAMRMPPSRTYLFTGERRHRIGANGENAASVLVMDSARGGSRSLKIAEGVRNWLRKAEIASDLKVHHISDRHYEIRIQHPVTHEYQNFADVGYGNSQVLPVLVGGFNLHRGSGYMVEEPEIHLHPRAQAELGDFFVELYERGVQSIVETHSEHLILRLQQHVASGRIDPRQISVFYVHAQDEKKCIHRLELNEQGAFVDEWPEGFFPERLREAKKLSQIRYRQQVLELE